MKKNRIRQHYSGSDQSTIRQPTTGGWEIQDRLETARLVVERGFSPTVEEKVNILKTRAAMLARKPETSKVAAAYLEVVEFLLAGERYAVEAGYVREICLLKEFTPLPGTPPFVLGIINVRGQILSVIDIKKFFELPEKGFTDLNKVIVLQTEQMEFGILADAIIGVCSIALNEIQPSLPTLTGIRAEYLRGIMPDRLVVLDAASILADKNIIIHDEVDY